MRYVKKEDSEAEDQDGRRKRRKRTSAISNLKESAPVAARLLDQAFISSKFYDTVNQICARQFDLIARKKSSKDYLHLMQSCAVELMYRAQDF